MRQGAGIAIDEPPANATPQSPTRSTLIQRCTRCGSHFEQDFEETRCANCVAWAELYAETMASIRAANRERGGR
jgi:hypothetical protein